MLEVGVLCCVVGEQFAAQYYSQTLGVGRRGRHSEEGMSGCVRGQAHLVKGTHYTGGECVNLSSVSFLIKQHKPLLWKAYVWGV